MAFRKECCIVCGHDYIRMYMMNYTWRFYPGYRVSVQHHWDEYSTGYCYITIMWLAPYTSSVPTDIIGLSHLVPLLLVVQTQWQYS